MNPVICLPSSSHTIILFYSLLVIYLNCVNISASYDGNETDYQALMKIKSMFTFQDPYGPLASWNSSSHFCEWSGVTCGKRHKRVTRLRLGSLGLKGTLSPHIGNLSFLYIIFLSNNSFQGAIPDEIGRLSRLRILHLYQNEFNNTIPSNLSHCSNLEWLILAYNNLVGSIPKEIGSLSKLTFFIIENNNLTGGIPPFLGNVTSMEHVSFKENPLGGRIPDTIGNWKNLSLFYSGSCNLYGTIPRSFYNLSILTSISLSGNQLTGSLPPDIGLMFPQLGAFQLERNQFTGLVPSLISNFSRLRYLQMNQNMFSGKVNINFAKLRDIIIIDLSDNLLGSKESVEMKIIDSLGNCTKLESLNLSGCKFQGVLPVSIGNLSDQLRILDVRLNQLYGVLPLTLGNLVGLTYLNLGSNQLTGNIPSTIGNLQKLQEVNLYENQLSGLIPYSVGNLSMLSLLNISSNMLEGHIPSSLGNCHSLSELYLFDNKLSGTIPSQLLKLPSLTISLDLSQNNLSGSLPIQIGALKMLNYLYLFDNNLSSVIPSELRSCTSLVSLSLKGNLFQGMIPLSLISLRGLKELDLSHNNLTGQIPRFLERFSLELLNLSFNNFEGEVPMIGVFANVSTLSVLGNSRLCGGVVELGLPKCNETEKHHKNFHVFVIVILVTSTLITITCLLYIWYKKKIKSELPQSLTRYKKKRKSEFPQSSTSEQFLQVSYVQLLKATYGFADSNLIGVGGFSFVYVGILENEMLVAIKVLNLQLRGAERSFMRECEAWRSIRHRNLLRIITSCSSTDLQGNDFKALVYEFMRNGSLHDWLHSDASTSGLNLLQRLYILRDVASALDYIHNQCQPTLVHGDLKPSNILLDDDMIAHVGDFGLAQFYGKTLNQDSSTGIRVTIGYSAPEYGLGNEITTSGDVYSFGILTLEVMTGKRPTDNIFNEGLNLHRFSSMALPDHVTNIIHGDILNVYQHNENADAKQIEECVASTIKIGVSCSVDSPAERMNIKNVLHELKHILERLQTT